MLRRDTLISCIMQVYMTDAIRDEAQAFLSAWFDTRRVVQTLNFNRFQQEGLSATQFIVLTMLGDSKPGAGPAELARRLNVDVTTTMRTVDSLVARGLLGKEKDPSDRRRWRLALTPDGQTVHGRIQAAFVDQVATAFGAMEPDLRAALVTGLAAFVAATKTQEGDDGRRSR
jgi:DNA-binding MarR family transcriptional regulator